MFVLTIALYLFICMFAIVVVVFWIWMIVDVVTKGPSGDNKIVWVLMVIFLNWIGALIHYFVRKRNRSKTGVALTVNPSPPS